MSKILPGDRLKKITLFFEEISSDIEKKLGDHGYKLGQDYLIQIVPNITNITYGRGRATN